MTMKKIYDITLTVALILVVLAIVITIIHYTCIKNRTNKKDKYGIKVINRGKCMLCGKELTEGLFFCKECEAKAESEKRKKE